MRVVYQDTKGEPQSIDVVAGTESKLEMETKMNDKRSFGHSRARRRKRRGRLRDGALRHAALGPLHGTRAAQDAFTRDS